MFGNDRRMSQELDNYITGHYGEDQFKNYRKVGNMNFKKGSFVRWIHQRERLAVVIRNDYGSGRHFIVNPEIMFLDNYEISVIHPSQLEHAVRLVDEKNVSQLHKDVIDLLKRCRHALAPYFADNTLLIEDLEYFIKG